MMDRIAFLNALRAINITVAIVTGSAAVAMAASGHIVICAWDVAACLGNLGAYALNGVTLRRLKGDGAR